MCFGCCLCSARALVRAPSGFSLFAQGCLICRGGLYHLSADKAIAGGGRRPVPVQQAFGWAGLSGCGRAIGWLRARSVPKTVSFCRIPTHFLAEGVAGPARICNAGAGCRDTRVAPRGRGGQVDGAGSLSRVFTATGRPQGTPLRMPWALPRLRVGFRVAGPVPRTGEDSTRVLIFQERWRNCGIGADWWGEMVQTWGRRGSCVGLDRSGPGNGWHGKVTFSSGMGERTGSGLGEGGCGRGVRLGVRRTSVKQYGERKAMAVGPELGAGAGCWRERRFWAHLVI